MRSTIGFSCFLYKDKLLCFTHKTEEITLLYAHPHSYMYPLSYNGSGEYLIIPAHLRNVPIHYTVLKNSIFVRQGCCKVVTKLSQGRNSFKSKVVIYKVADR